MLSYQVFIFSANVFFYQTFVASETATGKCTPVGAIIASHDLIENLVKCLKQLDLAMDHNFEPLYVTTRPYFAACEPNRQCIYCFCFFFLVQGLAHG